MFVFGWLCFESPRIKITRTLGTPTPEIWPELVNLPEYNPQFPKWPPQPLRRYLPQLSDDGLELLTVSAHCLPRPRELMLSNLAANVNMTHHH